MNLQDISLGFFLNAFYKNFSEKIKKLATMMTLLKWIAFEVDFKHQL